MEQSFDALDVYERTEARGRGDGALDNIHDVELRGDLLKSLCALLIDEAFTGDVELEVFLVEPSDLNLHALAEHIEGLVAGDAALVAGEKAAEAVDVHGEAVAARDEEGGLDGRLDRRFRFERFIAVELTGFVDGALPDAVWELAFDENPLFGRRRGEACAAIFGVFDGDAERRAVGAKGDVFVIDSHDDRFCDLAAT